MFPNPRKSQLRKLLAILCVVSFTVCIWTNGLLTSHYSVQASDLSSLVQSGVDDYRAGEYNRAIATWQQALDTVDSDNLTHQSILLENLARAHRQIGQFSQEIDYWEQTIERYEQLDDLQSLGRSLTEQAQAYNQLGQHRRALALLCGESIDDCNPSSALHIARAFTDVVGEAAALGSLGTTYRLTGNYEQAIVALNQSLAAIEVAGTDDFNTQAAVLNSLGNTYAAQAQVSRRRAESAEGRSSPREIKELITQGNEQTQQAIRFLQGSYDIAQTKNGTLAQVRSLLSLIPLYKTLDQSTETIQAQQTARALIAVLPDSQEKAFATLTLAGYLEPQATRQCPSQTIVSQQTQLLEGAIAIARNIQSSRAESFALGQLGNLYERCGEYSQALALTQEARLVADQNRSAQDSLYLWVWQQGRIFKAQGKTEAAASAYTQAIAILDTIRSDILNANQELQFDFRDRVEPIYREFAALKLNKVPTSVPVADKNKSVDTVLATLDSLKLAELQNYFANDCVIVAGETRVDTVSAQSTTAVISTAIWEQRTAVIASFPNGQQQIEWIDIDKNTLTDEVNQFRIALESVSQRLSQRSQRFRQRLGVRVSNYKDPATKLYEQIVRPFEAKLSELQIDSLVFINDGILRSIPMSALYDGEQFLIEKYALATTPSLTLTDPNALDRQNLSALILGLSEESHVNNQEWPALNAVDEEVATVKTQFPDSKVLKNEEFSEANLRQALQENSFRILHIATHGQFGTEPKDNFIITGQKIDEKNHKTITISELDTLIRSVSSVDREPIDLLSLTACETAVGDSRATLGLAGVAVRAGVRSAIASLWVVDDAATADLITRFYHHLLDPDLSKAEALRAAQLEIIQANGDFQHPFYWAPFVLIGNWL
ncbi:MAG: CHAT domain-containing protein [Cyanobacteria bacterium P01_B01_bin.77]